MKKIRPKQKKIFDTLNSSPYFWELVESARNSVTKELEKYKKKYPNEIGLETYKDLQRQKEAEKIIKKLFAPEIWLKNIQECIKTGKLDLQTLNAQILMERKKEQNNFDLKIRIFRDTTLDDIKDIWWQVKKYQKAFLREIKARKVTPTELEIYQWKKEGKSSEWIITQSSEEPLDLTPNQVNQIYSRMKKLLESSKK